MSQPFRDDFAAALDKASTLERENEELRDELARLRGATSTPRIQEERPSSPRPPPPLHTESPPDSLKAKTLERLERLSQEIDSHDHTQVPRATVAPTPLPIPTTMVRREPAPVARIPDPIVRSRPREPSEQDLVALRVENAGLRDRLARSTFPTAMVLGALFLSFSLGYCAGHAH